jgi:UDP-GlcNAc:undecaprenyl-phosphate GlcNAc-1-phosphate transferase
MMLRFSNGRPIFEADRNHLHHVLLDKLGRSHFYTSVVLFLIHLLLISLALFAM